MSRTATPPVSAPETAPPRERKFHLSMSVSQLDRSVEFYQLLFGQAPSKHRPDYAKFEIVRPPAVISLIPAPVSPGGNLNHLGLSLPGSDELVAIQERLERAGHRTLREDGVECCYARQTKFWVRDPDGALIELYVFHEDVEEHGAGHVPHEELPPVMGGGSAPGAAPALWTHRLGEAPEAACVLEGNSLQQITLEGSINDDADLPALLRECWRALRPGGTATLHGLAADRALQGPSPTLPGIASAVRRVPCHPAVLAALAEAGFTGIRIEKLSEKGYFEAEGVPLREVLITAVKPGFRPAKKSHTVVYLGPMAEVRDDFDNLYPRGVPVAVNIHDWQALQAGPLATQFKRILGESHTPECGGRASVA